MKTASVAAALALLLAAAPPLRAARPDCSRLTEAQVYAKSSKTIYTGHVPATYRVCVCDAEPVVELVADGKVVGVVEGGKCGDVTGTKIEVRASPDRGATVGYTAVAPPR
jgi:hypothetical protein